MDQIDIKSVLIGFLGSCLIFVLIAADDLESNNKNFGDIVVNSITIKDAAASPGQSWAGHLRPGGARDVF